MDKTTELKLQDYLHFYLGCECKVPGGTLTLTEEIIETWDFAHHGIKLLLRPLSDMTNEEGRKTFGMEWAFIKAPIYIEKFSAAQFIYLVKQKFNLFDPEWKHCIDSTTITN